MGSTPFETVVLAIWAATVSAAPPAADLVIADFEGPDYADWTVSGEAFGKHPASGTLPNQMEVSGFRGKGLVNSYYGGDGTTGTLTSPEFVIEREHIFFLIGGGMHPGETCVNLLVRGKVVRTATGPNDRPGGVEHLRWEGWDVSDLKGKKAVIEIVDKNTGGWGHINIDRIIQAQEAPEKEMRMTLTVEKPYLNLPVVTGAPMRRMQILLDQIPVREFDIELADDTPDFWAFCDLTPFMGKTIEVRMDGLARDSKAVGNISQDDAIRGAGDFYRERLRPQFHFSSRRGWNNDPNGLVFHNGEYHLYYQHNPYGWNWGNMHWGHAVSPDLVHWTELPIALYPRQYGDWCFSGSAVVDKDNTAGFKTGPEGVIVAAYTSTGRGECIAYSNDRGRTFTDYEGNPVVKHQGRDPKVIRHEPSSQWIMAVYDEPPDRERGIAFFASNDLKQWTFQSRIEGFFECPELFEMPIEGNPNRRLWVVYAASGEYLVGDFDGKTFVPTSEKHRFNWGNCFYASQTFNNIPKEDGRRIQIGWGTVAIPGMPFNQMMDFPTELTLCETPAGLRLFAQPVREIERIHGQEHVWRDETLEPGANLLSDIAGDLFRIQAEFAPGDAEEIGFVVRGTPVTYRVDKQELVCGDKTAPLPLVDGKVRLELLVDRVSIEVFGNDGLVYMPMGIIHPDDNRSLKIFAKGAPARASDLHVIELQSAW